jgi:hypothetical protein
MDCEFWYMDKSLTVVSMKMWYKTGQGIIGNRLTFSDATFKDFGVVDDATSEPKEYVVPDGA